MFKKAEKRKTFLRLGIASPSGGGKTYTALRIASGMAQAVNGKVAFIDSEKGSASLYADTFDFDVIELQEPYTVDSYVKWIKEAEALKYNVLVVDSLTHAWKQILVEIEKLTSTKYKGNSYRAWAEGTPMYDKLVDALLSFKGHIIMTSRSKTEYSQEKDDKGRTQINKVGLGIQNRQDFDYECTMFMEGTHDHYFTVTKDRTGKYQDNIILKPDEDFGKGLIEWLETGVDDNRLSLKDLIIKMSDMTSELMNKDSVKYKPLIIQIMKKNNVVVKIVDLTDIVTASKLCNDIKALYDTANTP
jgi:hypothetical protein